MPNEVIKLYSSKFELSENAANPNSMIGKFVICDFDFNKNTTKVDRDFIESWMGTLKNQPLVGKIIVSNDGDNDFATHCMVKVKKVDDFGNEYDDVEFDTSAFGSFIDVGIETIDGVEYLVATCEIWKRFAKACELIKARAEEGQLNTSFEVSVIRKRTQNYMGQVAKIIEDGAFFGHCLLGKNVEAAYNSSKLIDVASYRTDDELKGALVDDIKVISQKEKEGENLAGTKKKDEVLEIKVGDEVVAEAEIQTEPAVEAESVSDVETNETAESESVSETETSMLTSWDIVNKIYKILEPKLGRYDFYIAYHFPNEKIVWVKKYEAADLDYIQYTYTVENDEVSVSEPTEVKLTVSIAEVNDKIGEYKNEISTLKSEVAELAPFKDKFEELEQEKIKIEQATKQEALREKIISTKLFSMEDVESDEVASLIESLDENAVNQMIAERVVSQAANAKAKKVEVATVEPVVTIKTNIDTDDVELSQSKEKATGSDLMSFYLNQ